MKQAIAALNVTALAVCALALAVSAAPARAQPPGGDADAGHALAKSWCSSCHVVGPEQQHAGNDAVPSFAAIAAMPSTTTMSLRAFLHTPHPPMPDLQLSHTQVEDIATYILGLRKK